MAGGLAAEAGGGKFANGAISAAFAQAFNDLNHENQTRLFTMDLFHVPFSEAFRNTGIYEYALTVAALPLAAVGGEILPFVVKEGAKGGLKFGAIFYTSSYAINNMYDPSCEWSQAGFLANMGKSAVLGGTFGSANLIAKNPAGLGNKTTPLYNTILTGKGMALSAGIGMPITPDCASLFRAGGNLYNSISPFIKR